MMLRVLRVRSGPQKAMYQQKIAQLQKEGKLKDIDIYTMYVVNGFEVVCAHCVQ